MNDKRTVYIDFFGIQFPLCMTVQAGEEIKEKFGGFENLAGILNDEGVDGLRNWAELLQILMEGGAARVKAIAWLNSETVELAKVPDVETLCSILSWGDVSRYQPDIFHAMGVSSQPTVEVAPEKGKNAEATQE